MACSTALRKNRSRLSLFIYLKTLTDSWLRFFLCAVEQAITTYAEKRQNVEIKLTILLTIEGLGDSEKNS